MISANQARNRINEAAYINAHDIVDERIKLEADCGRSKVNILLNNPNLTDHVLKRLGNTLFEMGYKVTCVGATDRVSGAKHYWLFIDWSEK